MSGLLYSSSILCIGAGNKFGLSDIWDVAVCGLICLVDVALDVSIFELSIFSLSCSSLISSSFSFVSKDSIFTSVGIIQFSAL